MITISDKADVCGFEYFKGNRRNSPGVYIHWLYSPKRDIWLPFETLKELEWFLDQKIKTLLRTF
jgi:hypothetical protein